MVQYLKGPKHKWPYSKISNLRLCWSKLFSLKVWLILYRYTFSAPKIQFFCRYVSFHFHTINDMGIALLRAGLVGYGAISKAYIPCSILTERNCFWLFWQLQIIFGTILSANLRCYFLEKHIVCPETRYFRF